ncbi:MAG: hypothetical protein ACF8XB_07015 [Planctomycetota bacterium JB042]
MADAKKNLGKNVVIALALVATGFFVAYLRFRPHLGNESTWTDGERHLESAMEDEVRYALWDDPLPLPPTINTDESEGDPALSPDGTLLVFVAGRPGLNRDLYVADLLDGEPTEPRPLALLNSPADDVSPAFANGWLWFASDRAGGEGGFDLYRARYADGAFDVPVPVPGGLNSAADELDPVGVPGSDALVFASNRARGRRTDHDLYLAVPAAREVDDAPGEMRIAALSALNSPFDEREPAFAADGRTLYLASDRDGSAGGFDLWRSVKDRGAWLPPEPLVGLNGPASERAPSPSADGFTLLFAVEAATGAFDLYRARSIELFRVPGRPIGWIDLLILLSLLLVALLAWLAKRWEALDVLYKCFLVALLLHLLMLWWFQRVIVEGDDVELPGRSPLFKVSIASARTSAAATRERGGVLDARPERASTDAAPARHAAEVAAAAPTSAPARAARRANRPEAPAPARERREMEATRPRTEVARAEVALEAPSESFERMSAAPREVELRTPSTESAPARTAPTSPDRAAAASLSLAIGGPREAAPARPTLAKAARIETGGDLPERAGVVAPTPADAPAGGHPTLEDRETFEALAGAPPPTERPLEEFTPSVTSTGGPAGADAPSGPTRNDAFASDRLAALAAAPDVRPSAPAPVGLDPLEADDLAADGAERTRTPFDDAPRGTGELPTVALDDAAAGDAPTEPGPSSSETTASNADLLAALVPASVGERPHRPRAPGPTPARFAFDAAPSAPAPRALASLDVAPPPRTETVAPPRLERTLEHTPYKNRFGVEKQKAIERHGGSAETERAVALGLAYLADRQNPDGFWGTEEDYEEKYGYVCIGKTALCLLAFLGAGHTPASGTEYEAVARRAVDFLLQVQDEETGHFGWTSAYSHGIATYALAECHAITKDEALRRPLERAVAEIVRNQVEGRDPRNAGGWGYYNPDGPHYDRWSRVSVTSWQVMALESARLGGIEVDDEVFERAGRFLRSAFDDRYGYFRYSHDPSRLRSDYRTLPASTPAALFVLSLLGDDVASAPYERPRAYVLERRPTEYRSRGERAFVLQARGNLYFWYYATLAMFRAGGEDWDRWNAAMKEVLVEAQARDGSWRPISPYAERARDTSRDRCYTTAMCVLTLEVYYRYFTPLLKVK